MSNAPRSHAAAGSNVCGNGKAAAGESKRRLGSFTLALLCILCGCSCQGPYEVMNSADKGCAQLISLAEHLFGLTASLGAARRPRQLPLPVHLCLALASVGFTQLQNAALSTSLPAIVLITLKNGNLVANMLLGTVFMRRKYSVLQKAAVLLVTLGLICTTLPDDLGTDSDVVGPERGFVLGILLLAAALLCRAGGSILAEVVCRDYGAPVEEVILWRNLLGLPCVLTQWRSIAHHAERWTSSSHDLVPWPGLWGLLAMNVLFDHATRVAWTHLIESTSALTANLVLTIQRFVAFIIFAALLSPDSVRLNVRIGSMAVLGGSAIYSLIPVATESDLLTSNGDGKSKRE